MKKTLISIACALALVSTATSAGADVINLSYAANDDYYVGSITPGHPGDTANELGYIDLLITLAPGASLISGGQTYSRAGSAIAAASLPDPIVGSDVLLTGFKFDLTGNPPPSSAYSGIDVTAAVYILAKYDGDKGGSLVWLVDGLAAGSIVNLPGTFNGKDISHYTVFGGVPDGGATLMLLGAALFGLGALRRKFTD